MAAIEPWMLAMTGGGLMQVLWLNVATKLEAQFSSVMGDAWAAMRGRWRARRTVTHRKLLYHEASDGSSRRNFLLLRALRAFVASKKMYMQAASVDLCATREARNRDTNAWGNDPSVFGSTAAHLQRYAIQATAPDRTALVVGSVSVTFDSRVEVVGGQNSSNPMYAAVETALITAATAAECDAFVAEAFAFYRQLMAETTGSVRYMYVPALALATATAPGSGPSAPGSGPSAGGNGPATQMYDRYALAETTTFASVFFPAKEALVRRLDEFEAKAGKYAVVGVRHRLGILLHGPPGTGKTSTIKAVAHKLKRHIIAVPLSKIRTNEQLMRVLYGTTYEVAGAPEETATLGYGDVVFVMEDMDCLGSAASAVTASREGAAAAATATPSPPVVVDAATAAVAVLAAITKPEPDALNLSGLLNAIDGAVDTPGLVLVLTSNYPERLDAALVRDGRIDVRLCLGYMAPEDATLMAQRFFPDVTVAAVAAAMRDVSITPASVEGAAMRAADGDEFLAALSASTS